MDTFHIEIDCQQTCHAGEQICGDVYLPKFVKEERRIVAVLSDGMGHGVKANVLATLTATLAANFTVKNKGFADIARTIMRTLPVCSVRQSSYSTFSVVDINTRTRRVRLLEYDNPRCLWIRGGHPMPVDWQLIQVEQATPGGPERELRMAEFEGRVGDMAFFWSDGVSQSGIGTPALPTGWGLDAMRGYVLDIVRSTPDVAVRDVARRVVNRAVGNDGFSPKDDVSCMALRLRRPQRLLICTGPPFDKNRDRELVAALARFDGKKILCGATTAEIVSRITGKEVVDQTDNRDPTLPPTSMMEGVDLITEGILTLSRVSDILRLYAPSTTLGRGPADQVARMLLDSDEVNFLVGTCINTAHQDPSMPIELELRKNVVRRIAKLMETKFLKDTSITYM